MIIHPIIESKCPAHLKYSKKNWLMTIPDIENGPCHFLPSEHHQPWCDFHILQQLHHLRRRLWGFAAGELPQAPADGAKDLAKGGGDPQQKSLFVDLEMGEKMGKRIEKVRIGMVLEWFDPPKNGEVK
jgi:hypothetical protein